jgi:hypothetical protein
VSRGLAGGQLVQSYNPEENSKNKTYASDYRHAYQDDFDVEFRFFPVRLLGYVKQASRRLKEVPYAHSKPRF